LSDLESVRKFVGTFCLESFGDSIALSDSLKLAINEVFCNIVKHGYRGESGHQILIKGEYTAEGVALEISDQGISFDPSDSETPNFSGDQDSGFGLYIIKDIADSITYQKKESEQGWNHLRIFKRYIDREEKMKFSHFTDDDQVLVVTFNHENLDAKKSTTFKKSIIDLVTEKNQQNVVFDLDRLQFIDSSGLGTFLSVLRVLNMQGGDLKLANMQKPIRTMFEIVRMHKLFEIYNSTEDAVHSFQP